MPSIFLAHTFRPAEAQVAFDEQELEAQAAFDEQESEEQAEWEALFVQDTKNVDVIATIKNIFFIVCKLFGLSLILFFLFEVIYKKRKTKRTGFFVLIFSSFIVYGSMVL